MALNVIGLFFIQLGRFDVWVNVQFDILRSILVKWICNSSNSIGRRFPMVYVSLFCCCFFSRIVFSSKMRLLRMHTFHTEFAFCRWSSNTADFEPFICFDVCEPKLEDKCVSQPLILLSTLLKSSLALTVPHSAVVHVSVYLYDFHRLYLCACSSPFLCFQAFSSVSFGLSVSSLCVWTFRSTKISRRSKKNKNNNQQISCRDVT